MRRPRDSSLSRIVATVPVEQIEIRIARPEEYTAAGAVTALAYTEFAVGGGDGWSWYLEHIADVAGRAARTTVLVAVAGGIVIGTATLELEGRIEPDRSLPLSADEAHIRMVGVHPDHRRRGVARGLVTECVAIARAHGKHVMTLDTGPAMSAAQALYDSMGFTRGPTREVEEGFFLVRYELRLDAAN